MKTLLLFLSLAVSFLISAHAHAEDSGANGVGIVLGEPTGFTFQHKLGNGHFTDYTLAYDWDDEEWMLMGDYKVHLLGLFGGGVPVLPYIGGGLFLHAEGDKKSKHHDDLVLGLRVPFGVEWKVPQTTFVLFGEIAPGMEFVPETDAEFQAGVGGRFFF